MLVSHILSVVQTLTGLSNLRCQITAQDVDLFASNASLRKANVEHIMKDLFAKVVELKSKIEELDDNHAKLVRQNAKLMDKFDAGRDKLAKEKAKNANLKAKLGVLQKKVQFIAVDAILHARADLMGNSRGESMLIGIRIRRSRPWGDSELGKEGGHVG